MSGTAALASEWDDLTSEIEVNLPMVPDALAKSIREAETRRLDAFAVRSPTASPPTRASETASGPVARSAVATFTALQEWDGYVVEKNGNSFTARLTDITSGGSPDSEEVEIPYEELDDSSINRIKPGSLFRWSIGYEKSSAGQKTRVSRIIVRQLPRWRKSELEKADREASELVQAINWHE